MSSPETPGFDPHETKTAPPVQTKESEINRRIEQHLRDAETARLDLIDSQPSDAALTILDMLDTWQKNIVVPEYHDPRDKHDDAQPLPKKSSQEIVFELTGENQEALSWRLIKNYLERGENSPSRAKLIETFEQIPPTESTKLETVLSCYVDAVTEKNGLLRTQDFLCPEVLNQREFPHRYQHEIQRLKTMATPEYLKRQKESEKNKNQLLPFFIYIDLNNFKTLNDNFGHDVGNQILLEFSHLLRQHFSRDTDQVGRVGGDEFAVLARSRSEKDLIVSLVPFIREIKKIEVRYYKEGQLHLLRPKLECSVGVALITKDSTPDSRTETSAQKQADDLSYTAKTARKETYKNEPFCGVAIWSGRTEDSPGNPEYISYSTLIQWETERPPKHPRQKSTR